MEAASFCWARNMMLTSRWVVVYTNSTTNRMNMTIIRSDQGTDQPAASPAPASAGPYSSRPGHSWRISFISLMQYLARPRTGRGLLPQDAKQGTCQGPLRTRFQMVGTRRIFGRPSGDSFPTPLSLRPDPGYPGAMLSTAYEPTDTILVTGASGFLGPAVCRRLNLLGPVHGLSRTSPALHLPRGLGVTTAGLADLRDQRATAEILDRVRPWAVVHMAAMSKPEACQKDHELSRRMNLEATELLADLCAERGLYLAFTSTDFVFSGQNAPYAEDADPDPGTVYGEHKRLAELAVLDRLPDAAVLRLSNVVGRAPRRKPGFVQALLDSPGRARPLPLFADEYRTFVDSRDVAEGIALALENRAKGIFHLAGPQRMSRLELGRMVEKLCGHGLNLAESTRAEADMVAPRPGDLSLSMERTRAGLGFEPVNLRRALAEVITEPWWD